MLLSASRALLSLYPVLPSLLLSFSLVAAPGDPVPNMTVPPKAGAVELFPEDALKPGLKGVAWTVFEGSKPEPVPVEIVGIARNMWGPRQDIIIGKLGGRVQHTNVAGGMSGSCCASSQRILSRCHLWYYTDTAHARGERVR
jgi:hypothetical protein